MKKIVGILAGAALLATSVFAADVSAKVKVDGSLFNYNDGSVGMFSVTHKSENWNPDLSFAVSTDNAGASFKIYSADTATTEDTDATGWRIGNTFQENAYYYQVWVKPLDVLKLTLGQVGTNLNQETIDWSNTHTGIDSYGYGLGLTPVDGLSLDFILAPGWSTKSNTDNYWFGKAKDKDATVAETYIIGKYAADFGTIGAYLDATNTFKSLEFGAGYSGAVSSVNFFAQAIGYVDTTAKKPFTEAEVELFAKGSADAFSWAVFCRPTVNVALAGEDGVKADALVDVFATAKISYALESVTPFLYVKCSDFVPATDAFSIEVKPGVSGSVGVAYWEIDLDMNIGKTFTLDVPVTMSIGF